MATAAEKQREVARAVALAPPTADVLVYDARTRRAVARRPGSGRTPAALMVVVGPGGPMAMRPENAEGAELGALNRERRRAINRARHAIGSKTMAARMAPGATSAPHGAPGGDSRPSASASGPAPHTRPRVIVPD